MSISSLSSLNYSSTLIQQTAFLFSSSVERNESSRTERTPEHGRDDRHGERSREADSDRSRRGHETERSDNRRDLSELREAFKARHAERHDDDRSGARKVDDDDRRSYQSFSASSISISIEFSSILQLQAIDDGAGQTATPAAPANATVAQPIAAPVTAPVVAPVALPAPEPVAPSTSSPTALAGVEDTLKTLAALLQEAQSPSFSALGTGSFTQSFQFEAEITSLSLKINPDQSYELDLTSISIAFSQNSSLSFTDGAATFAETQFSLDIQAYSASLSTEAYSNSLVSNLLNERSALFA